MFAIKGWSVDAASLKPQTEPINTSKSAERKRKRGDAKPEQSEDVGKLWDEHIEGKKPVKAKSASSKERKKQKLDAAQGDNKTENADPASTVEKPKGVSESVSQEESAPATKAEKKSKTKRKRKSTDGSVPDTSGASKVEAESTAKSAPPPAPPVPRGAKLTPMQAAMRQKLVSARFRHLNQTLYTAPSNTALELFDQNPEMFEDYHAGFRQQVSVWPENPVDNFIATLRVRGAVKPPKFGGGKDSKKGKGGRGGDAAVDNDSAKGLPRTHGTCIIADLGCGDARLAQTLKESNDISKYQLKIHS